MFSRSNKNRWKPFKEVPNLKTLAFNGSVEISETPFENHQTVYIDRERTAKDGDNTWGAEKVIYKGEQGFLPEKEISCECGCDLSICRCGGLPITLNIGEKAFVAGAYLEPIFR